MPASSTNGTKISTGLPIEPIIVGKLGPPYGIRGWIKVFASTTEIKKIFDYQPWFIQKAGQWQWLKLEQWKYHYQDLIIKVKNIKDRETIKPLTNCKIIIDAAQLPHPESGEYYWRDLLRCQVITLNGYKLGKVTNLIETGSNDVLIVQSNPKDAFNIEERLIPFLSGQVIKNVNLKNRTIDVDWDPSF